MLVAGAPSIPMITGERSFMRIAIDYDGTWDRDPEAFLAVALAFRDAGHEVVMVTVRSERRPGSPLPSVPPWITVYATGLAPSHAVSRTPPKPERPVDGEAGRGHNRRGSGTAGFEDCEVAGPPASLLTPG